MNARDNLNSFALLSPCGFGNLGDAATMEATIQNIRRRIPDATIRGITLWPEDTRARHGIVTFPLSRASFKQAWLETPDESDASTPSAPPPTTEIPRANTSKRGAGLGIGALLRAVARMVLPKGWPWAIRTEMQQTVGAYRLLQSTDMVILSGGGQLDDFHGGPWKQPYALAKWAVLAKLTGTGFVVLSTGFGSLDSLVSRVFARLAWHLSDYRSYRDPGSRKLMREAGFRRDDPVFPDLAFSLNISGLEEPRDEAKAGRVCISPMVYLDPERWPTGDGLAHTNYLSNLADFAERLIDSGVEVVLIASDGPDKHTVKRLRDSIRERLGDRFVEEVHTPTVDSVDDFLRQAARCEFLIASRLHGIVLSHLTGTPAIALSYDRKVREHMQVIDQMRYCLDVDDFDADRLMDAAQALKANLAAERSAIREKREQFRSLLEGQYDAVLGQESRDDRASERHTPICSESP
jgi:polysaccharide pyruvyl transferase WcaK-like protein